MSGTKQLFESIQGYLKESFQKVDKTIKLTDTMLKEIPLPSGEIVFDEEIYLPGFETLYKDGRIRVVIADRDTYWSISEYSIGIDWGYGGYTLDIDKSACPTIEDVIENVFMKGEFSDIGYSISGIEYPEDESINESSDNKKVTVSVYNKVQTFNSRNDAIKYFEDALNNSEGAERDRYIEILQDLKYTDKDYIIN